MKDKDYIKVDAKPDYQRVGDQHEIIGVLFQMLVGAVLAAFFGVAFTIGALVSGIFLTFCVTAKVLTKFRMFLRDFKLSGRK